MSRPGTGASSIPTYLPTYPVFQSFQGQMTKKKAFSFYYYFRDISFYVVFWHFGTRINPLRENIPILFFNSNTPSSFVFAPPPPSCLGPGHLIDGHVVRSQARRHRGPRTVPTAVQLRPGELALPEPGNIDKASSQR